MGRAPIAKTELGQRLLRIRGSEKRSDFCTRTGVSDRTFGNYERGTSLPDTDFLSKLAESEGINLNWLVTGRGEMYASGGDRGKIPPDERLVGLDAELLESVVTAVAEWLQEKNIKLPADKLWLTYMTCYRVLFKQRQEAKEQNTNLVDFSEIHDVLKLATK